MNTTQSSGGKDTLAFLSCTTCQLTWEINHVPIDKSPWSVVNREGNDRFRCPGCGKAVAWRIHGPTWRPTYGAKFTSQCPIIHETQPGSRSMVLDRLV